LACAAALAVIETIETEGLLQRARDIEAILFGFLRALQQADPRVGDVRGRGAMVAVELIDPLDGRPDGDLAKRVASFAHGQGVVALTCGTSGNVIRFLPPLSISDELLVEGLEIVAQGLRSAQ